MSLASFSDANGWLDEEKLRFVNAADAEPDANKADAIVKAALVDLYPDAVNKWIETVPSPNPDNLVETPALVRQAAAMLMAAFRYQRKYSEEALAPPTYALLLESRAMNLLKQLREGSMSLADVEVTNELRLLQGDFWPNDTTVVSPEDDLVGLNTYDPLRFFGMNRTF